MVVIGQMTAKRIYILGRDYCFMIAKIFHWNIRFFNKIILIGGVQFMSSPMSNVVHSKGRDFQILNTRLGVLIFRFTVPPPPPPHFYYLNLVQQVMVTSYNTLLLIKLLYSLSVE